MGGGWLWTPMMPWFPFYTLRQRTLIRKWLKLLRNYSSYNIFQGYLSFVRKIYRCRFRIWMGDKAVRLLWLLGKNVYFLLTYYYFTVYYKCTIFLKFFLFFLNNFVFIVYYVNYMEIKRPKTLCANFISFILHFLFSAEIKLFGWILFWIFFLVQWFVRAVI